jgi:hypothetical protein
VADRDVLTAVWNRACRSDGTGVGDRHLSALLMVDGMIQNGGPNHAADSCSPAELGAAAEGARYFGLGDLAALIEEMPAAGSDRDDDEAEDRLSEAYRQVLPDSDRLEVAFAARYEAAPNDFQPI